MICCWDGLSWRLSRVENEAIAVRFLLDDFLTPRLHGPEVQKRLYGFKRAPEARLRRIRLFLQLLWFASRIV